MEKQNSFDIIYIKKMLDTIIVSDIYQTKLTQHSQLTIELIIVK
jgi:hypothetical protein